MVKFTDAEAQRWALYFLYLNCRWLWSNCSSEKGNCYPTWSWQPPSWSSEWTRYIVSSAVHLVHLRVGVFASIYHFLHHDTKLLCTCLYHIPEGYFHVKAWELLHQPCIKALLCNYWFVQILFSKVVNSGIHMNISWKLPTLEEARGFIDSITITFTPTYGELHCNNRQVVTVEVPGNSTSKVVGGLNPDLQYSVTVSTSTCNQTGWTRSDSCGAK